MTGTTYRQWTLAVLLAGLFALVGAAADARAAGWLAPVPVSTPQTSVGCGFLCTQPGAGGVDVAIDGSGNTYAAWTRREGSSQVVQVAIRPAGGSFGPPQDLGTTLPGYLFGLIGALADIAVDAQGNAVVVWPHRLATTTVIQASVRPAGGAFAPPVNLSDASRSAEEDPRVAMSANGTATAVWSWNNGMRTVVQAATRPPGGAFPAAGSAQTETLSNIAQNASNARVAMGANGATAVTWVRSQIAQARVRPAGGAFAAVVDLSPAGAGAPEIAVDPAGRATAVWLRADFVESRFLTAAGALDGGIDNVSDTAESVGFPSVALDASNNAVAVWTGGNLTKAASRPSRGSFGAAQAISSPGDSNALPKVAVDPAGNATAIWSQGLVTTQAARRALGASFGGVENLSSSPGSARAPSIAVDDQGNTVVAWAFSRGAPTNDQVVQVTAFDPVAPAITDVSVPSGGTAGAPLQFSANAFDRWSGANVSWDFGDGSAAAGTTVPHTYGAPGTYTVTVSASDAAGNATSVQRTVQVAAPNFGGGTSGIDNDKDGFFAGQDCNDANAAIRPGAVEVRGNRLDENCDGLAEPFPTLTSGVASNWDVKGTRFTLRSLQVTQQFPKGFKVQIKCSGKPKCPFKTKSLKPGKVKKGAAVVIRSLSRKQRRFRAGQTLEVWVSAPNFNTKVARLALRKGKIPTTQPFCVIPGQTKPQKTCS